MKPVHCDNTRRLSCDMRRLQPGYQHLDMNSTLMRLALEISQLMRLITHESQTAYDTVTVGDNFAGKN